MGKKYYAVKNGKDGDGIYETWEDCKAQVHGVKSVVYKGFPTRAEAEDFLARAGASATEEEAPENPEREGVAVAYVDGSFDQSRKAYSYGCILLYQGKRIEMSKAFFQGEDADMRNVAGELEGAMAAMAYCRDNVIPLLHLYYDYQGIASWATGEWKRNKPGTIRYKAFYDSLDKLQVVFHKVKGHSGVELNEAVDKLAKAALGL